LLLAAVAAAVFHEPLLRRLAHALITSEAPEKADLVIVLAGDSFGGRILKGCELIRAGYAPKALVSGPPILYGRHEDEFSIPWAVEHGCSREWFEGVRNNLKSTREEAALFRRIMLERGVKTYLLVTSNFHTARAARIFRREIPDIRAIVIAAPYPEFDPDAWWKDRQQRKVFAIEWMKTVTEPFGI
jgi:uncharacterized SAM-binding protein YcdF (DUF218 family)